MISLTPLIQLLAVKPAGFTDIWFRQVGGAAEFAQVRVDALPLPAAWVIRAGEKVKHAGIGAENINFVLDVVIAIENVRRDVPGEMDDALLNYRRAVKNLLLGWEIEADVKPMKFDGGQVLEYTDGDIYWRDRYAFTALITNYLPDPPIYGGLGYTGTGLL